MVAIEILGILLLGWALAKADMGLRKSLRDIDEMPGSAARPFDGETEQVWAELAAMRDARRNRA